jgi:hypothetical protein
LVLKATYRPSAEIDPSRLSPLPCPPPTPTEASVVRRVKVSRTKTSRWLFVSLATRSLAYEEKTTYRPSADTSSPFSVPAVESPAPPPPPGAAETSLMVPGVAGAAIAPTGKAASASPAMAVLVTLRSWTVMIPSLKDICRDAPERAKVTVQASGTGLRSIASSSV